MVWADPPLQIRGISPGASRHLARLNAPKDFEKKSSDTPYHPGIADLRTRRWERLLRHCDAHEMTKRICRPDEAARPSCNTIQPWAFCYLDEHLPRSKALATGIRRVAVYDFDVHHGNQTRIS